MGRSTDRLSAVPIRGRQLADGASAGAPKAHFSRAAAAAVAVAGEAVLAVSAASILNHLHVHGGHGDDFFDTGFAIEHFFEAVLAHGDESFCDGFGADV